MHQQLPNQMLFHQQQSEHGINSYPSGSPKRFLSEGELLSRTLSNGLSIGNELSYANRTNSTADHIRFPELAGSPQRSVYNWKDTSPTEFNSQTQTGTQCQQQLAHSSSKNFVGRPPLPLSHQNPNKTVVISAQQQQKQTNFDFSF